MSQNLPHDRSNWDKIEHVVHLMLENRSFDNLLGCLYDESNPPPRNQEFNGVRPDMFNTLHSVDSNGNPFVEQVYVRRNGEAPAYGSYAIRNKVQYKENFSQPNPDPGEGFIDTNQQLFGVVKVDNVFAPTPTMLGFVDNYQSAMLYGTYGFGDGPTDPRSVMTSYTRAQTPVLSKLAAEFAVCDEWFGSVPSQTWPNRAFAFAATSDGNVNNRPDWVVTSRTLFDQLHDAGKPWRVYCGVHYDSAAKETTPFSLTQIMLKPEKAIEYADNFVLFDDFFSDVEAGTLPAYSFLEPQFSTVKDEDGTVLAKQNDQHPHSDVREGEQLIAAVYETLRDSDLWKKTLLVITYDEHGGGYDHVAPPGNAKMPIPAAVDADGTYVYESPAGSSDPIPAKHGCFPVDPLFGFRFNRFGVRVPTVLVSPWIERGTVARPEAYHDPGLLPPGDETAWSFDHTSLIASVRNCFGLEGCLTDRDRYAPDLSCVLHGELRTDRPKVAPLPTEHAEIDIESHLLEAISDHLGARVNSERRPDESATDHVARTYQALIESEFTTPPSMSLPMCHCDNT